MTDYGPTDNSQLQVNACTHCWHLDTTSTYTLSVWPPPQPRVCCHCGLREWYRPPQPPIPEGHGRFYPQPYAPGWSWSGTTTSHFDRCPCNPKNGGSGVCGCILNASTTNG